MTHDWLIQAEAICMNCGGNCCTGANPPISEQTYRRLLKEGLPEDFFEKNGYRRMRSRADGTCVCWKGGKCSIHGIKPETCRAGPFTFDVKGDRIEIFLKFESICPIVRLLREVPAAYEQQYSVAVTNISRLVADLPDDELAVICCIDEPETEKVADIPKDLPKTP
jgi:Fe-S-cluster containining protein